MRKLVQLTYALVILGGTAVARGQAYAPAPVAPAPNAPPAPVATTKAGNAVPAAPPAPPPAPAPVAINRDVVAVQVGASPPSLTFGERWNGDPPEQRFFTIDHVPRRGPVKLALAGSGTFRIIEMRLYSPPAKGALASSVAPAPAAALGPAGVAMAHPRASSPIPSPVPPGQTSLYANYVLKTTVTSAPFSAMAEEGDRLYVAVEFAPKFSFEEGAGPKAAHVDMSGALWTSKVDLNGYFDGLKIGLVFGRPPTFYAADQPYAPGTRFPAYAGKPELSVVNATGQPQSVQLSTDQLPAGVQVAPQQVQFAAGETRSIPLAVTWDPRVDPTGDVRLRLRFGSSTSFATMRVEHVPFSRSFRATGGGWSAEVTVHSNGEIRYNTQCFISGLQFVHDCTYYFYRNGGNETSTLAHATAVGGTANDTRSWTNHTGLKPDETFDYLEASWALVEFDSSQGDPSAHSRIALVAQP